VAAGTQVAEGVHRLGSHLVNYYLVEDGEALTLVDAGLPGLRTSLDDTLAALGRSPGDIQAVVLTHAHNDHVGFAEKLRAETGVPVHVHREDEERALTLKQPKGDGPILPLLRHAAAWRLLLHFARNGRPRKLTEVTTFGGGDVLDVPGRPVAVPTPGHTAGHVSLHFPDRGVLLVGDAMNSRNPMTGRVGPQLMPSAFNTSTPQALESLSNLEGLAADVVAFGHGDPWHDGPAAAVARARELGTS
jgi:glyoxylase-like metal-dependent hydrolase (beta-lactamase superfamily II)